MSATIEPDVAAFPPETDPAAPRRESGPAPRWAGPVAGLLAAALALGVGALVASLTDAVSPFDAVGSEFIDATPAWLKELAIDLFGTSNKAALRVGMAVVIAGLAAAAGAASRRRHWIGPAVMLAAGAVGAVVSAGRPGQGTDAIAAALVAAVVGATTIWWLSGRLVAGDPPSERPGRSRAPDGWDRRSFMAAGAGTAAVAIGTSLAATGIDRRRTDDARSAAPALPDLDSSSGPGSVASSAPEVPAEATLSPVSPFITPVEDFYHIDTALSVPRVRVDRWALQIDGMVERPVRLTYADLLERTQIERHITIACVSNEVGGGLVGTATWQGVSLAELLTEAGVRNGAEQLFATSVDGWTCGFPITAALDGRDAMVAIGMNGEPLTSRHGFPARIIVPGLYGYVSATKWVERLEVTTWDAREGYWIPRGWAREAPIKTQSRIDVPRRGSTLQAGRVAVAGVAWAPRRGITKVEVRVDDGDWSEARLGSDVSTDTWRQWVFEWQAEPGEHVLQVRATDGDGVLQTDEVSRPDPDGATGHHTRRVVVEE